MGNYEELKGDLEFYKKRYRELNEDYKLLSDLWINICDIISTKENGFLCLKPKHDLNLSDKIRLELILDQLKDYAKKVTEKNLKRAGLGDKLFK